jgi:hypothetical protein
MLVALAPGGQNGPRGEVALARPREGRGLRLLIVMDRREHKSQNEAADLRKSLKRTA